MRGWERPRVRIRRRPRRVWLVGDASHHGVHHPDARREAALDVHQPLVRDRRVLLAHQLDLGPRFVLPAEAFAREEGFKPVGRVSVHGRVSSPWEGIVGGVSRPWDGFKPGAGLEGRSGAARTLRALMLAPCRPMMAPAAGAGMTMRATMASGGAAGNAPAPPARVQGS